MADPKQITEFKPSLTEALKDFQFWQVEALLSQAADLVDRSLNELREYRLLDNSLNQLTKSIEAEEAKQVLDDRQIQEVYQQNIDIDNHRQNFFLNTGGRNGSFQRSVDSAARTNQNDPTNATKLAEKEVEADARFRESQVAEIVLANSKNEKDRYIKSLDIQRTLLKNLKETIKPDLEKQKNEVEKSAVENYKNAFERLIVARKGLVDIYGYLESDTLDLDTINTVADLALWTRDAIEFIVKDQLSDQAVTRIVSVKALAGDEVFNNLENNSIKINIPASIFDTHTNVRLRSIGATIIGEAGTIPWSLTTTLPRKALYKRESDKLLNQQEMPTCLLGRVENHKSFRPIELCGALTLMNASPIGQPGDEGAWVIKLEKPQSQSEKFSDIEDLLLEINFVGNPKR